MDIIRGMAGRWSDEEIAATLNRLRLHTGTGKTWSARRVYMLRHDHDLPAHDPTKPRDTVTLDEATQRLGVSNTVVKKLIAAGLLAAKQAAPAAPWEISIASLDAPEVKRAVARTHELGRAMRAAHADKRTLTLPGFVAQRDGIMAGIRSRGAKRAELPGKLSLRTMETRRVAATIVSRLACVTFVAGASCCGPTMPSPIGHGPQPLSTTPTLSGMIDQDGCGAVVLGALAIDDAAPCVSSGWPDLDTTDDVIMATLSPASVTIDWSTTERPVDGAERFFSNLDPCLFGTADRPVGPTPGFFSVIHFDLDKINPEFASDVAQKPYSISCSGEAVRSGYIIYDALVTESEIENDRPVELRGSGDFTATGAETYFESKTKPFSAASGAANCPDGNDGGFNGILGRAQTCSK
jgi:hypothetical protein